MEIICNKCRVRPACIRTGSSPLTHLGVTFKCELIGNYGREPVDISKISPESMGDYMTKGKCLTLVRIPMVSDGHVFPTLHKIWSPPILSPRETSIFNPDALTPRSHR